MFACVCVLFSEILFCWSHSDIDLARERPNLSPIISSSHFFHTFICSSLWSSRYWQYQHQAAAISIRISTQQRTSAQKWKYFFAQRIVCLSTVSVSIDEQFRVLLNMAFSFALDFSLKRKIHSQVSYGMWFCHLWLFILKLRTLFDTFFFVPLVHTCWLWNFKKYTTTQLYSRFIPLELT